MRVQSELVYDGHQVSITNLCRWLGFPRRSFYYQPVKREKKLDPDKVSRVKKKIEDFPTYGYRRLALVLGMNKKAVQRILQLKEWQVKKRFKGHRLRAKAVASITTLPNRCCAIDMTRERRLEHPGLRHRFLQQIDRRIPTL